MEYWRNVPYGEELFRLTLATFWPHALIYLFIYLFHQIHIHIIQSLMNDELLR